jgi:two-component system sensor histidine kinase YesM
MNKIIKWLKKNELFTQLLAIVIICVITVCLFSMIVVFNKSKNTYVAAYQKSNKIIMEKVQEDYESLNENINLIFEITDNSQVVEDYLTNPTPSSQTIINLKKQMNSTRSTFNDIPSNLVLTGKNGASFFQNDAVRKQSIDDLLNSSFLQKINQNQAHTQYFYRHSGLTTSTAQTPGLLYVRKLTDSQDYTFGYAFIFIAEQHFSKIYQDLLDDQLHTIYITDASNNIVSSNKKVKLNTKLNDTMIENSNRNQVNSWKLYSYNFTLYNILNEEKLVANMNMLQPIILITVLAISIVSFLAFFIIRKTTQPIYHLIDELPEVTQGDFSNTVKIEGSYETQELGKAYNLMLKDLQTYFDNLIQTESDKRLAEIQSLQMQIQPHFIYNTLTAIKFLIWQGENDKASLAIENFIVLLRLTLSNKGEVISLREELKGVEAYIQILQLRYGDSIHTNIFADEESEAIQIPKMIIQPIIENAYLHAFPNQREGFIQLFTRISQDKLRIEVIDNGTGFDTSQSKTINSDLKRHYSGIGLANINERIRLLYGPEYGLQIKSSLGFGTTVTLLLPLTK